MTKTKTMYSMKQACDILGINYEALRFYCNEGLVPHVKRDENNYRWFDERDMNWLKSLLCLKRSGMTIKQIKAYLELCMQGISSVQKRKEILAFQQKKLLAQIAEIQCSIDFINEKQHYFDEILAGRIAYTSNLIDLE